MKKVTTFTKKRERIEDGGGGETGKTRQDILRLLKMCRLNNNYKIAEPLG